jgi:exosome complex RNA-binding protein Csl4
MEEQESMENFVICSKCGNPSKKKGNKIVCKNCGEVELKG